MKIEKGRRPNYAWMIGWVLIIAAALSLGIMQCSWIARAADSEQERQQRILMRDGARAIEKAFDELQILLPLVRTSLIGAKQNSKDDVLATLLSYQENSPHPGFLKAVWIFIPHHLPIQVTTSQALEERALPLNLHFIQEMQDSFDYVRIRDVTGKLGFEGMIPIDFPISESSSRGLAVIELDVPYFFQKMLGPSIQTELPLFSVDIQRFSSETEMQKAMEVKTNDSHLNLLIPGFPFVASRGIRESSPTMLSEERWPLRLMESATMQEGLRNPGLQYIGRIRIDLNSGTLAGQQASWAFTSMLLSSSIIMLLVLSLATVFSLYRKNLSMRHMEQEFTASMSHELRLPITVLKAIGDNLACGVIRDEQRIMQYGKEISQKSDRLHAMVEGILLYSGLQQGGRKPERSRLDIQALTTQVIQGMELLDEWKSVAFTYFVQTGEIPIYADVGGVELVIRNLLMNAVFHGNPPQADQIPSIHLSVIRKSLHTLSIIVEDNGNGIPKKSQKEVLYPFFRMQRSIADQKPGSGLGLYITKRTAELNGGSLTLESPYRDTSGKSCRGCRFTVEMEIEEGQDGQNYLDSRG